jgi:hydroxymethylbilane synthase
MPVLRIATRESRLALWQAHHVAGALRRAWPGLDVEILGMSTRGDQVLDQALSAIGGKGLFTKELETALLEGRADLAVHSLKDVPMSLAPEFELAAVMAREDPRDALVSERFDSLEALPQGARVGSSSLRRSAQLLARRPDLNILPCRGNLDTRLRKLAEGQYEAIILASAGLKRLGMVEKIREVQAQTLSLPAPAQGVLGIEIRSADDNARRYVSALEHPETRLVISAERALSERLGGSCKMPLAAYAEWCSGPQGEPEMELRAELLSLNGQVKVQSRRRARIASVQEARDMGMALADELLKSGGQDILASLQASEPS